MPLMAAGGNPMGTSGDLSNWSQIGVFFTGLVLAVIAGIYRFAGVERVIDQKASALELAMRNKIDEEMKAFGDTGAALRQKINEVELWSRDTFVRRDEFTQSITQVNRNIDALRLSTESAMKSFDAKLDSLDQKLDRKLDKIIAKQG